MAQNTDEYASVSIPSSLQRISSSEFYYLELYKAVLNGDWESASKLLADDPKSFSAPIGTDDSPMLHIAVELGEARMGFVEKLVEFMPSEALALRDSDGATALFNAARAGNIKAVKLLVKNNPSLPNICNHGYLVPLHSALSLPPDDSNLDLGTLPMRRKRGWRLCLSISLDDGRQKLWKP
ncbi:hypothetical protein CK203_108602 [Vitis vinifera]|uniref:Uncharacterized protein n=1 Tax=Vitis vinifera TaxID=29760 RepID=A0A438CY65_VITVI|nr:hypothetical protein CK203_108602 [Vitis vinifera]